MNIAHSDPKPRRYCRYCGDVTHWVAPIGDEHPREVCPTCGAIHYDNPKTVTGCIVEHEGRVLLCKRAISPRYGWWTLPAGFMELHEHGSQAAIRETWEESGVRVEEAKLFACYTLLPVNQVYLMYRAQAIDDQVLAGMESLESRYFTIDEIPWEALAFPIIGEILQQYCDILRGVSERAIPLVGEMDVSYLALRDVRYQ